MKNTASLKSPAQRLALAQRNSVVYHCLSPEPGRALLFGNGPMGGSVHTPDDSLYLLVARCDTWTGQHFMGSIAAVRIRGGAGLFQQATSVRQECDLARACIRIDLETAGGPVKFKLTATRGKDLLLIEVEDGRTQPEPFEVFLENWHEGDTTAVRDGNILATTHLNRESVFEERNRRIGIELADIPGVADPLLGRAWALLVKAPAGQAENSGKLALSAASSHRILVATACLPPAKGGDTLAEAEKAARAIVDLSEKEEQKLLRGHEKYWKEIWSKSYLNLTSGTGDAEYEERLWYVTLYTLICGSGGPLPLRFNGGHYLLKEDLRSWDNEYVFQNSREIYWALFGSGHEEFFLDYFRLYDDVRDFIRIQTKHLFGIDGLCYREGMEVWGGCVVAHDKRPIVYHYFSSNLEFCLLMEWYYQASGDEAFLRDQAYPIVREILQFYISYAKKEGDGKYHISPANALEIWWNMKDDMPDMCGLHHFLPRMIEWGGKFGEDPAQITKWKEFHEHLAPIPVGRMNVSRKFGDGIHPDQFILGIELDPKGVFLPAAGTTQESTHRGNMENPELYAIYPWGVVGKDSPTEEVRRAENTWNHRSWRYPNNGWSQDVPQLARMGWEERARVAQMEHASLHQRFPNGTFISPARPHHHTLLIDTPYFDTSGVHVAGLNEMLLQSYDGVIRFAPALSPEWSGEFGLHAFGGFDVEVRAIQGQPVLVEIHATRDSVLKVRNHRKEAMLAGGKSVATGDIYEQPVKAGETVSVRWENVATAELPFQSKRPDVIYPGYKVRPPHTATHTGHWHDESVGHGQIGLEKDGLFPATRLIP